MAGGVAEEPALGGAARQFVLPAGRTAPASAARGARRISPAGTASAARTLPATPGAANSPPPPLGPPVRPRLRAAVPLTAAPPARRVALAAISGKGIWLTLWPGSRLSVRAVVATARRAGLHQLWARTGGTTDGFYGGAVLRRLVPAAHAAGISVVAWDFPTLSDPAADAARAASAFRAGADAFSADIETASEGTYLTARRVRYYLSLVRAAAGNRPVIATVPRPTTYWLGNYPYGAEAPFVDAFAPMVYWSCTEPGSAVGEAMSALSRACARWPRSARTSTWAHRRATWPALWEEDRRFLDVAYRLGAIGASLYDLEAGGKAQLRALAEYPW